MGRNSVYLLNLPPKPGHKRFSLFSASSDHEARLDSPDDIPQTLDSLTTILQMPARDRSPQQTQFVQTYTKNVTFFMNLAKEEGDEAHRQCCLTLQYEYFHAGQFVFRQGDQADRFYIVLEGTCGVQVTNDKGTQEVRVYGKGESFGELALLKNQPRAASIQCKSHCHFAVLMRDTYNRTVERLHRKKLDEKVDFLLSQPMFKCWTKGSMTKLSYYFFERQYRRKQTVYRTGDESNALFLIRDGEFRLTTELQSGRTKKTVEIASLIRGEVFGVEEVLEGVPRTCSCVCYSSTADTFMISKDDFMKRVKNEEKLAQVRSLISTRDLLRAKRLEMRRSLSFLIGARAFTKAADTRKTPLKLDPLLTERLRTEPLEAKFIPTGSQTCRSGPRSNKTWDRLLVRSFKRINRKKSREDDMVVNIHTQGIRIKLAEQELEELRSQMRSETVRSETTTPRSALAMPLLLVPDVRLSTPFAYKNAWRVKKTSQSVLRPMQTVHFTTSR